MKKLNQIPTSTKFNLENKLVSYLDSEHVTGRALFALVSRGIRSLSNLLENLVVAEKFLELNTADTLQVGAKSSLRA